MPRHRVTWVIDSEQATPVEAAREALETQRKPDSTATYFEVKDLDTGEVTVVDLDEIDYATASLPSR